MQIAGCSMTVTSITNLISFGNGIFSTTPVLQVFIGLVPLLRADLLHLLRCGVRDLLRVPADPLPLHSGPHSPQGVQDQRRQLQVSASSVFEWPSFQTLSAREDRNSQVDRQSPRPLLLVALASRLHSLHGCPHLSLSHWILGLAIRHCHLCRCSRRMD